MALLVPVSHRTLRTGLVDALSAHYGSLGILADYINRRQFEKNFGGCHSPGNAYDLGDWAVRRCGWPFEML